MITVCRLVITPSLAVWVLRNVTPNSSGRGLSGVIGSRWMGPFTGNSSPERLRRNLRRKIFAADWSPACWAGRLSRMKSWKTYRFSKDWEVHRAMTVFTLYSANFCWCVRTLREEIIPRKRYRQRTAAMAAGLADHVWTLKEWLLFPSTKRYQLPPFRKQ